MSILFQRRAAVAEAGGHAADRTPDLIDMRVKGRQAPAHRAGEFDAQAFLLGLDARARHRLIFEARTAVTALEGTPGVWDAVGALHALGGRL